MAIIPPPFLFSWQEIDAQSDLDRLRLVLAVLPDERLVWHLEQQRGKGRDDFPIRPMWNATLAGVVFQHPSVASLIRELRRNAELRQLCGFDPFRGAKAVPPDDAFSRFLSLLLQEQEPLEAMCHALVEELSRALPDLGEKLAVDSKAIASFGRPVRDELKQQENDRRRDTDADWGTKTYEGMHQNGSKWQKVVRWFGYKLHLLVDSRYELPLAFEVTRASAADSPELIPLVEQLAARHPETVARAEELAADRAYDAAENNTRLYEEYHTLPVIDTRRMWKDEPDKPRVLFGDRYDVFSYGEDGRVYCTCPATGEQRQMSFAGFEQDRETLKYRCPAAACGLDCRGRAECERLAPLGVGEYGRVARVPLDYDRRIFTPLARHTAKWEKAYDRRTAVERVNSRIDRVLGFELHTIRGLAKMKMRVTLALVVMLAMALGRIRANQADLMRSLTAPVRRAA